MYNCNYSIGNTGAGCTPLIEFALKLFFRPLYDSAGNMNSLLFNPPGTITTAGSTAIVGVGTQFTKDFRIGDVIYIAGEPINVVQQIATITNDTHMTVSTATVSTGTGFAYNQYSKGYISALVNQPDPSKRLYPTPTFKNADNTRGEAIFQTWDDGTMSFVQQGPRKFKAIFTPEDKAASPQFKGQLDTITDLTQDITCYVLDGGKNFVGEQNTPGWLDGMKIDTGSFVATYNPGKNKEVAHVDIEFNIHPDVNDANLNMIANSEMQADAQNWISSCSGLLDVAAIYTECLAAGTVTVQLNTLFGTMLNPLTAKGLVKTNLSIYDVTTAAALAVTSVTEVLSSGRPTGVYDVVFAAASVDDELQFTWKGLGYDFSNTNAQEVVAL